MTTQTTEKTFRMKVRENWYGSLERAFITLTTPKGNSLTIDKWPNHSLKNKWDATKEGSEFVWGIYNRIYPGGINDEPKMDGTIEMTKEEVLIWKSYSNQQDKEC
jgi:hypothetical protein